MIEVRGDYTASVARQVAETGAPAPTNTVPPNAAAAARAFVFLPREPHTGEITYLEEGYQFGAGGVPLTPYVPIQPMSNPSVAAGVTIWRQIRSVFDNTFLYSLRHTNQVNTFHGATSVTGGDVLPAPMNHLPPKPGLPTPPAGVGQTVTRWPNIRPRFRTFGGGTVG